MPSVSVNIQSREHFECSSSPSKTLTDIICVQILEIHSFYRQVKRVSAYTEETRVGTAATEIGNELSQTISANVNGVNLNS